MIRGILNTFKIERAAPTARVTLAAGAPAWPDDAARAFAVEFVSAYLTHSPTDKPGAYAAALEAFVAPELVAELAPRFDSHEPREAVRAATVAGVARLDDERALVTVTATLDGPTLRRSVAVPIVRDHRGGLVVDDLPSVVAAPPRPVAPAPRRELLVGAERAAILEVLAPFMRAYLTGDTAALSCLVPPGTRIPALEGHVQLRELTSVGTAGPATPAGRVVLLAVRARGPSSRATYALRYRVRLVRRHRWYVAELNGPGRQRR